MQKNSRIKEIINRLNLEPHIEGGYYKRYYQSLHTVTKDNNEICKAGSCIYYLLEKNNISQFHSITSDEIWHFYEGGILEIHEITETEDYVIHYLGSSLNNEKAEYTAVVKRGSIFAAKINSGEYVLAGCSLHPEFLFKDFKMYDYNELITLYPALKSKIDSFYNQPYI